MNTLLIFGLGYCGHAVANAAAEFNVMATSRSAAPIVKAQSKAATDAAQHRMEWPSTAERARTQDSDALKKTPSGAIMMVRFDAAEFAIAAATHILVTAPPDTAGDPVLHRYNNAIATAPRLQWIGYLSSTVVYGDRDGAWVDEDTPPAPSQPRGQRRLEAELAWSRFATCYAVDIFRLGGIYGPGRSVFDDLRAGTARRMSKPGHQFGRIHRDDIARAVTAAMRQAQYPRSRVLNLVDDVPAESAAVITEAAQLMGVPPPSEIAFADALPSMSAMARSFWAENRKVSGLKTQQALGLRWLYPGFREGLAAIWREESSDRTP